MLEAGTKRLGAKSVKSRRGGKQKNHALCASICFFFSGASREFLLFGNAWKENRTLCCRCCHRFFWAAGRGKLHAIWIPAGAPPGAPPGAPAPDAFGAHARPAFAKGSSTALVRCVDFSTLERVNVLGVLATSGNCGRCGGRSRCARPDAPSGD